MQTFEECFAMYEARLKGLDPKFAGLRVQNTEDLFQLRCKLRSFLSMKGVLNNPGVSDVWILDRVEEIHRNLPLYSVNNS